MQSVQKIFIFIFLVTQGHNKIKEPFVDGYLILLIK